jgi:tetratricopeptide (TPR) repeat protein
MPRFPTASTRIFGFVERPRSHELETESRRALGNALPVVWVARDVTPDYGVDIGVEIFEQRARTGRTFNVQLKSTDEQDLARALRGSVRFDLPTVEYYKALPAPMLVVLYHAPTTKLYQQWLHAYDAVARGGKPLAPDAKTMALRFVEADAWQDDTPERLDAGVRGFNAFRSPALLLPIRLAVHADAGVDDALPVTFALREALKPVADLVAVEHRDEVTGDEPAILLAERSTRVTLADVASVTLPRDADAPRSPTFGPDLVLAIAVALANVGQTNIAAQLTTAVARKSVAIGDFGASIPLSSAMAHARRIRDAIELADDLDNSEDDDIRLAGSTFLLLTRMLAPMSASERQLAIEVTQRRLDRRLDRGERANAGAEAYNIGMLQKAARDNEAAIAAFERALELEPRYAERAYFHNDLGGALFEGQRFAEAATSYGRAIKLGAAGMTGALYADALLLAGRYAEAEAQFDDYLKTHDGSEDSEWRLKRSIMPLVRCFGGDVQARDPERADALAAAVDLQDPALTVERALATALEALHADACCGEAWFRYMFAEPAARGVVGWEPEPTLAAAVLLRYARFAWLNAAITAEISGQGPIGDILQTAYRFEQDEFVKAYTEAIPADIDPAVRNDRLRMLEEAIARQEELDRRPSFTMRFSDEQGVSELHFGDAQ